MTPNKVILSGYKRFEKTSTILDRNLIALVGPNEAGKSSFFEALLSIENRDPFSPRALTKGNKYEPSDTIVKIEFLLNDDEKKTR